MPGSPERKPPALASAAARVARFLAIERNIVLLLIAIVVIGAGEEMWMRFLPKYLEALGAGVFVIGLFDAMKTLLGAFYAWPGGVIVDRFGHRRALMAFNIFSILGYALVLAVPHWGAVFAGMFLFLGWSCFSLPATFSLIGSALAREKHAMGIGVQSLVKRLPILFGPLIGGVLIDRLGVIEGVRVALAISIVLSFATIFFQNKISPTIDATAAPVHGLRRTLASFPPGLWTLLASDILVRFCERIPYAWIVIYAMNNARVTGVQVGVLTTVEMLTAMACFIPVAHWAEKTRREPFVGITFVFFTLFPLSLMVAKSFPLLLAAFAIRGLKEFGEPARKALIIGHCEPSQRGRMVGAYYLMRDTIVTPGAILGAWLWQRGAVYNFWAAAIFGAAGTVFYFATARRSSAEL